VESGSRSVDTNVLVRLLNGEPGLAEKFDSAGEIFVCPVVVGELLFGARNSARVTENVGKVEALIADLSKLDWTWRVSERYAEAKLRLRHLGRPIPENDIWIASFALAYGLKIIARDSHFDGIEGLTVESW
jgi:tRNA(fMet)-specific endonuclease VapC